MTNDVGESLYFRRVSDSTATDRAIGAELEVITPGERRKKLVSKPTLLRIAV
jgi:hypothetical protein